MFNAFLAAAAGNYSRYGRYEFVGRLHGHKYAIHAAEFSPGGIYLASGSKVHRLG
jgi:hypothetical protein